MLSGLRYATKSTPWQNYLVGSTIFCGIRDQNFQRFSDQGSKFGVKNEISYETIYLFKTLIRDVVGEVLRDLQASVTEGAFYRLDWLLDIANWYADSLSTTVDQIHFLLREARECLCAHSGSFGVKWGWQACTTLTSCF